MFAKRSRLAFLNASQFLFPQHSRGPSPSQPASCLNKLSKACCHFCDTSSGRHVSPQFISDIFSQQRGSCCGPIPGVGLREVDCSALCGGHVQEVVQNHEIYTLWHVHPPSSHPRARRGAGVLVIVRVAVGGAKSFFEKMPCVRGKKRVWCEDV
jgi:hypothetical protein